MARVTFNGTPGETFTNDGPKVQYQLLVDWHNSCGVCAQYDHAVGPFWPTPFHRGCRCKQKPIWPGEASEPYVDFMAKIRELDRPQQSRVIGAANLKLVEKGTVKWDDVVTRGRVRTLQEVVSREKLSVEAMVKAGVPRKTAEKAHAAVNTVEHQHVDAQRRAAVQHLKDLGVGKPEIKQRIAEKLVEKVGVVAGPIGPTKSTGVPLPQLAAALGVRLKLKVGDPERNIARAAAVAEKQGFAIDAQGRERIRIGNEKEIDIIPALYRGRETTILINQEHPYWNDPVKFMRENHANRWFSSRDPDHIITHEIGHARHDKEVGRAVYARIKQLGFNPDQKAVARRVSRYAKTKPVEFVAETYAGLKAGMTYDGDVMALYAKLRGPKP